jgi:hypothetical protein
MTMSFGKPNDYLGMRRKTAGGRALCARIETVQKPAKLAAILNCPNRESPRQMRVLSLPFEHSHGAVPILFCAHAKK